MRLLATLALSGLSSLPIALRGHHIPQPRALAVGMVDADSGLCAVLHYWDDAPIVSSQGRPQMLPIDEKMLYVSMSGFDLATSCMHATTTRIGMPRGWSAAPVRALGRWRSG